MYFLRMCIFLDKFVFLNRDAPVNDFHPGHPENPAHLDSDERHIREKQGFLGE